MLADILRKAVRKSKLARVTRAGRPRSRPATRLGFERLEERTLLTAYPVTTAADSGAGSLRDALTQAMASAGNTVTFNISGAGVHTIHLTTVDPIYTYTALPLILNSQ